MIGRTLGHYRVLEKLGEGGMGEVYLSEDTTLHRKVALKILPTDLASSRERLERFQREAESLAALNHPNIVHVYTVEEDDGVHFLTMELVEGESLDQVIFAGGIPLEQFFDLAVPLADALSEAHEKGIVHRDLKPANVMVDRKGRPKILDFGLAKLRLPERSAEFSELPTEVMTEEGKVLGTYPYMSPEQVEGKSVDHRSDIFSFGTMMYEMATGHRPFTGDSPASMMSAILRDKPLEVDAKREELPHHLGRIISRCLEKQADDRYQRAKDLGKDLEELRQEVQTGVATASRPAAIPVARNRWGLFAGACLIALLVATVALFLTKPWEKPPPIPAGPRITSLAVLPLENLSGDPEQQYYAAGITEGLIADLGRIAALRVISRQSVMRYKSSDKSLPEIARELGVEALIEGSVLPAGDRVRVTAQLIQADPEQQLWSDTYERDTKDILRLLSDVTREIVAEIEVAVSPEETVHLASAREVDPVAHKAYLRGVHIRESGTPDAYPASAEYFRQAVELDPSYAPAWLGLARHYLDLALWLLPAYEESARAEAIAEANAALETALEIDDSLGGGHLLLALKHFWWEWDWARAEQEFQRAIQLSPNDAVPRIWYSWFLSAMGRHAQAAREADRADQLDPRSPLVTGMMANQALLARDFERAIDQSRDTLELSPGNFLAQAVLGWALVKLNRQEEVVALWQELQRDLGNLALAEAYENQSFEGMMRIYLDYFANPESLIDTPSLISLCYAAIGENEEAIEWLEAGYALREDPGKSTGWEFVFLKVHPIWDDVHSDPRFQDLLRRMNFPE